MEEEPLRLFDLAYACRLYREMTNYDEALKKLPSGWEEGGLDLEKEEHRHCLLRWLNNWGCRQFSKKHHEMASRELLDWSRKWARSLPHEQLGLIALSSTELTLVACAYHNLSERRAGLRNVSGRACPVRFGPAGAAKTLFALRRRAFPPWDERIRKQLECDDSESGYLEFLKRVSERVQQVIDDARRHGIDEKNIPEVVGREGRSLVKLIDEYHWVTITKGSEPPNRDEVLRWAQWVR